MKLDKPIEVNNMPAVPLTVLGGGVDKDRGAMVLIVASPFNDVPMNVIFNEESFQLIKETIRYIEEERRKKTFKDN